ncbi:MAG: efflux RND transporter periplasmic adaptor subunit [Deltaproteobacteria bacterium]|nr:efflux RND transporter periplasmic adaptor subunit [Deltaproteobacteria bacterium]
MISMILFKKLITFAMALAALSFLGCGSKAETDGEVNSQEKEARVVSVRPVEALPPTGSVEYVGTLAACSKVKVSSEISGTIERLCFEKGDRVHEGQLLAEINTTQIRLEVKQAQAVLAAAKSLLKKAEKGSRPEEILIARAGLKEAEASSLEAENEFKRINELHRKGAVSNSEYDSAKRMLDTALARRQSAKQQLEIAEQGPRIEDRDAARANLEEAEAVLALAGDRLKKSIILAPCSGAAAFREVEKGEVISFGTVITQIINTDCFKIRVSVSERDIYVFEKHSRFDFKIDAIPNEEFSCSLSFRSPVADPVTRSFPVELTVDDKNPWMSDGMTVRVMLPLVNEKKMIKVPAAWLAEEEGRIGMFIIMNGKALFRPVSLGQYYDRRVEILSGLSDGDQVIINPEEIKTGDQVRFN